MVNMDIVYSNSIAVNDIIINDIYYEKMIFKYYYKVKANIIMFEGINLIDEKNNKILSTASMKSLPNDEIRSYFDGIIYRLNKKIRKID